MAVPVVAALKIVSAYIAKNGTQAAVKKFGKDRVKQAVKNENRLKNPVKKNKQGVTTSVMGKGAVAKRDVRNLAVGAGVTYATIKQKEKEGKPTTPFEKAFSKAHNAGKETFTFNGKPYTTDVKKGK